MKVMILAGGKGTRLWPLSRDSYPKQFLKFGSDYSLLQKTILRFLQIYSPKDILIITSGNYLHLVKEQCKEICNNHDIAILTEPCSRNTAPAIALGALYFQERLGALKNEVFLVSSSDHFISPTEEFNTLLPIAEEIAKDQKIVTFGVYPTYPETGYGYIKCKKEEDQFFLVEAFMEKPSQETAIKYLLSGDYLWNAGIFAFRFDVFWQQLAKYALDINQFFQNSLQEALNNFSLCKEISIDYAILEKSNTIAVIPMKLSWSDVGSWDSVYDTLEKDENNNVKQGNVVEIDTKNCLIIGGKRLVTTIGIEDTIIVETQDALLITKKGISQKVKDLVNQLIAKKIKESSEHITTHRPWGSYTILDEGNRFKIKKIIVQPSQRLSLQKHYHRSEHWVVISGMAKVTRGEEELLVHENESIYLPKTIMHRLENPGKIPLELIEVQVGEYLGEDDIIRFQDDYQRSCAVL